MQNNEIEIVNYVNNRDHGKVISYIKGRGLSFKLVEDELKQSHNVKLNTIEVKDFLIETADRMMNEIQEMEWTKDSLRNRVINLIEQHELDCSVDELYDAIVEDYSENGDHENATNQDIIEIYDASF